MNNDLISREALKKALNELFESGGYDSGLVMNTIDNAPIIETDVEVIAKDAYKQGEYVDISKLRLMTVEECAGHTIDYAMGWKACIEWIKKGGAE